MEKMTALIRQAPFDVVLFIDANAKVGSVTDAHIGAGGFPQTEDRNGRSLHAMLINTALFIPSTFVDCHIDHATHEGNRLDDLIFPLSMQSSIQSCSTVRDFDPWVTKEDHWPVVVETQSAFKSGVYKSPKALSDRIMPDQRPDYAH